MSFDIRHRDRCLLTVPRVLSADECQRFVSDTDAQGYRSAPITTALGFMHRPEIRNNGRVIVDDHDQARWLWSRIRDHIPARYGSWTAIGLNERFRYYRYERGQYFKWHYDGAYVRSPTERSILTLMVYLNDDFEGGSTDFYDFDDVTPEQGMALVFDHGLRHQGASVERGRKYVLRTDVMYARAA